MFCAVLVAVYFNVRFGYDTVVNINAATFCDG